MATAADSTRSPRKQDSFEGSGMVFKGRSTFIVVALAGGVLIFLGEPLNSPFLVGVFGPLFIMGAYMALGFIGYVEITDNESFADSIYYIGFILTLVSLAAALFYLRNENIQLSLLVSKFGLALLTTIVGLSVRVALVNFKVEGNDARRTANEKLSNAMERFTKDIEITCDKVEMLLSGSLEQVQTTANEVSAATTLVTKAMQEETKQTSKHIRSLHEKSEQQWTETITTLTHDLNQLVSTSTEFSVERLRLLNEKIHTEMDSFHIPSDIVTSKLNPVLDDVEKVIDGFTLNMSQLVDASAGHKGLRIQFDEFGSTLESSAGKIKDLAGIADSLSPSFNVLKSLDEGIGALSSQLASSAQSLDKWSSTVSESETVLKSGADAGRLSIEALAQEIRDFVRVNKKQSEIISQLVTDIGADAKAGQESLNLVQKNLVDSSRVIIENLKP